MTLKYRCKLLSWEYLFVRKWFTVSSSDELSPGTMKHDPTQIYNNPIFPLQILKLLRMTTLDSTYCCQKSLESFLILKPT